MNLCTSDKFQLWNLYFAMEFGDILFCRVWLMEYVEPGLQTASMYSLKGGKPWGPKIFTKHLVFNFE